MKDVGDFTVTGGLVIITALLWLLWDVYVYISKKETISQFIVKSAWYSPLAPFVFGFLMGHWFW
jgi:hypothetical protein